MRVAHALGLDDQLRELVGRGLREEGFAVTTVRDAAGAMGLAERGCDLLVLDVGLPDADGRDLCAALRARGVLAPVLFLTARDAVADRLSGFAAGGDDYLVKPFHFGELVARLQALLKRTPPAPVSAPGLVLDPASHDLVPGWMHALADPDALTGVLTGALAEAITSTFGSLDALKAAVNDAGVKRFGSGWTWLVKTADGKLAVVSTANQDNPMSEGHFPLLGNDVWEHAYYLKYQNKRPDYLAAWWNTVNWEAVGKRFEQSGL